MLIFGRALKRTLRCSLCRTPGSRTRVGNPSVSRPSATPLAAAATGGGSRNSNAPRSGMEQRGSPSGGGGLFDFFAARVRSTRPDLSEHQPRRPLPDGAACTLLLSDQLFDLWQPGAAGRPEVPGGLRGAGGTLRLPQSRPGNRTGHLAFGIGSMDLPVALRYRKEFVKGCSCKKAEYNPEIEAANKQAQGAPAEGATQAAAPAPAQPDAAGPGRCRAATCSRSMGPLSPSCRSRPHPRWPNRWHRSVLQPPVLRAAGTTDQPGQSSSVLAPAPANANAPGQAVSPPSRLSASRVRSSAGLLEFRLVLQPGKR